jgi:hypothetical protein
LEEEEQDQSHGKNNAGGFKTKASEQEANKYFVDSGQIKFSEEEENNSFFNGMYLSLSYE